MKQAPVFFICGPGGVGKTTLSSCLALGLSENQGKRLLLTVDPAKRLARILGFESFQKEENRVEHSGQGELYASQLETKRAFDEIFRRLSPNSKIAETLLNHPIYQTMTQSLGGTHEYAAIEKILHYTKSGNYDQLIVDTPPSENAIDLFAASGRLSEFMGSDVFGWLQNKISQSSILSQGSKWGQQLLSKLTSQTFLSQLTTFITALSEVRGQFEQRQKQVSSLLKSTETVFIFVSTPAQRRFEEFLRFNEALKAHEISLNTLILNQVTPDFSTLPEARSLEEEKVLKIHKKTLESEQYWIQKFEDSCPHLKIHRIPKWSVRNDDHLMQLISCGKDMLKSV